MDYIIVILLIACSALFSGLTLGLLGLDVYELKRKADLGDTQAKAIYPVRKKGNLLLTTLLLGNVAVNTILAVFLSSIATGVVATIIATGLIFIFGEIIPQATISRHAMSFGAATSPIVRGLLVIFYPIAAPISWVLDKALGAELPTVYSKHELAALIAEHGEHEEGTVNEDEGRILHGALMFSDKTVHDVMTPRTVIDTFAEGEHITVDLLSRVREGSHTRWPVMGDSPDKIVGFVHMRDLVGINEGRIEDFTEELFEIAEGTLLNIALNQFIDKKQHMFAVRDEFGGFTGVVTLEDVLEEILQVEIMDEDDRVADLRALAARRARRVGANNSL